MFALSDLLARFAPFSRCSYSRLAMFTFGYRGAFQGISKPMTKSSPGYESYSDMQCQPKSMPSCQPGVFKQPGKCQLEGRRHGAHQFFGAGALHAFRTRRCFAVLRPCSGLVINVVTEPRTFWAQTLRRRQSQKPWPGHRINGQ